MQYNTTRKPLIMREYGRTVQALVERLQEEPDREKRTSIAYRIIDVMVALNPTIKVQEDYKVKLWDQLHIMTGLEMDVDCPYPKPDPPAERETPTRLPYPKHKIARKHYGLYIDELVQRCRKIEDPEKREEMAVWIGSFMKTVFKNWQRDGASDVQIKNDLRAMSEGEINLAENVSLNALAARGRNKRGVHDNVVHQHYDSAAKRRRKRPNRGGRRRR